MLISRCKISPKAEHLTNSVYKKTQLYRNTLKRTKASKEILRWVLIAINPAHIHMNARIGREIIASHYLNFSTGMPLLSIK